MITVSIHLSGPAQKKVERTNDEGETVTEIEDVVLHYDEEITNYMEFHRIACKKSHASRAEKLLPDEYMVHRRTWDDWSCSLNANATDLDYFAEHVSDEEGYSKIDVLSRWLQSFNSMRIRRALHSELEDEGIDVRRVD